MRTSFTLITVVAVIVAVLSSDFFLPSYPVPPAGSGVLITGCSSGIGRSIALRLAKQGFTVFAGVRKEEDKQDLDKLKVGGLIPVILDVTSEKDMENAINYINSSKVKLYGLVNNGGVSDRFPFEYQDSALRRKIVEVNLMGAMELTAKALPLLKQNKGARIINIGSLSGERVTTFASTYSASKFGLRGLTEGLRRQLYLKSIHASIVEPGFISTPMASAVASPPKRDAKEYSDYFSKEYKKNVIDPAIERFSLTTEATDEAIEHAFLSPKPRSRYLITNLKYMVQLYWYIPDWLADIIQRQAEGIDAEEFI